MKWWNVSKMKRVGMLLFSLLLLVMLLIGEKKITEGNKEEKIEGIELGIEVLTQEEIDILCGDKEFLLFDENVRFEDKDVGYDVNNNMLLIPQNLEEQYFDGIISADEGEQLYFLQDELWGDKATAISSNHVFRLFRIGEDRHWMYNVYFTGMPVAKLYSAELPDENDKYKETSGTMWVYDQYDEEKRYQEEVCRFRLRGASSFDFPKPSFKVTFTENDVSLLGMREDDDWILNSLYDDEGLIHNKISYELWQQIAATNRVAKDEGISMEYVELFVDNKYLGVYGLLERVDKKELGLNAKDILYKGVDSKEIGEDDFYLELTEDMKPAYELKYPTVFTKEEWEPLKTWINDLYDGKNMDYKSAKQILNMENATDYLLFNVYIGGDDNTKKNIYYWADYQTNGTWKMIKIPWDLNITWGNSYTEEPHKYHFNIYKEKYINGVYGWTKDMEHLYGLNPEEMGEMLSKRWKELRKDIITIENIHGMLNQWLGYIHSSGAYVRDCMFWGSREEYWTDAYIYDYAARKIEMMDQYIESLRAASN